MGLCSKRHFLLTICTLQLITTIERQVFDFLGFMWVPILVNFFNIIFVILGFFGAFQYRPKYIISYCVWNVLWLGWNVFLTCFYLSAGLLDKNSDLLNLGTGSFSWWQINGPGCKPHYNNSVPDQPDVYRPVRPDRVTGCVLDYEVIEVVHSSTQCLLAVMAVIGGICLSRVFLEEDDSFDFVGGGDFGLAGHTPLHPMYVSYSALPPHAATAIAGGAQHSHHAKHSSSLAGSESYYYPGNTGTATTTGSHRSSSATLITPAPSSTPSSASHEPYGKRPAPPPPPPPANNVAISNRARAILRNDNNVTTTLANDRNNQLNASFRRRELLLQHQIDFADYSNPIDHIVSETTHHPQRAASRFDYDTLDQTRPRYSTPPIGYSPLARHRHFNRATSGNNSSNASNTGSAGRQQQQQQQQHRNSYRPTRVHADFVREQQPTPPPPLPPPAQRLRSFYSDPRLSVEEEQLNQLPVPTHEPRRRGDGRPLSMFVNNY